MTTHPPFRKIYFGEALRCTMFDLMNRHQGNLDEAARLSGQLIAGEWFEVNPNEFDYMLNVSPPLFFNGEMFAMSELRTGSVASVFVSLPLYDEDRCFHGYCDLTVRNSPRMLRSAIADRERLPMQKMTRAEKLEHIWSTTHPRYRGYADDNWIEPLRGRRTLIVYGGQDGARVKVLENLTEEEIQAKLPVHLRNHAGAIAA